ncbi:MAG TPA: universal stress protein [Cyclobacteriaceae bacterium]|nr:universal stress protein [Cyclobacteriaceae bacterium]
MENIKNILVGLDMTDMDFTLLKYVSFIVNTSQAERVIFVNVVRDLHIPEEVLNEFPELVSKALEERKNQLTERILKNHNLQREAKFDVIVKSGSATKVILETIDKEKIDLLLIGHKLTSHSNGVTTQRLARRCNCLLLIAPENSTPKVNRILVPIDFSEYSKLALERVCQMASNYKNKVAVECIHAYNVPVGYHYSGKSFKEFAEVMKKNAEQSYKQFIKTTNTFGIKPVMQYVLNKEDDLLKTIHTTASRIKADGIVVGAKGKTSTAALFLGNFAEKLVSSTTEVPILLVRPKGKSFGLIDYIKEL